MTFSSSVGELQIDLAYGVRLSPSVTPDGAPAPGACSTGSPGQCIDPTASPWSDRDVWGGQIGPIPIPDTSTAVLYQAHFFVSGGVCQVHVCAWNYTAFGGGAEFTFTGCSTSSTPVVVVHSCDPFDASNAFYSITDAG